VRQGFVVRPAVWKPIACIFVQKNKKTPWGAVISLRDRGLTSILFAIGCVRERKKEKRNDANEEARQFGRERPAAYCTPGQPQEQHVAAER
jgi:hypothetical protein